MEIEIKASQTMDKEESKGGESYENRIVRIPKAYRETLRFDLGVFIKLRNLDGSLRTLQVAEAFVEDVTIDQNSVYVTSDVYNKLFLPRKEETKGMRYVTNVTLGCDPEVFLVSPDNRVVEAHRLFRKQGEIGHDGIVLEFRPEPSAIPEVVCNNLYHLINKTREMLNYSPQNRGLRIVAGSSIGGYSAGFHLHFELPKILLHHKAGIFGLLTMMASVFDYYIGVPSIIPEGEKDVARRTKPPDYGRPGDYRVKSKTFEYRVPGGINMSHPLLARGLMALGSVVVEDVASRISTCTDRFSNLGEATTDRSLKTLYPNLPDAKGLYSIICTSSIGPAKNHLIQIKEDVRKMVGYKNKMEAVESYFNSVENNYGNNIEQNWKEFFNEKR